MTNIIVMINIVQKKEFPIFPNVFFIVDR